VHQVRAEVNEARAAAEPSLMAQGVFRWAARESRRARGPIADQGSLRRIAGLPGAFVGNDLPRC
jgi:hypothetical protein